jgi:hypothetical protein
MVKSEEEDFSVSSQLAEFLRLAPGPATFSRFKFDQENARSKPDLVGDNDLASMRKTLLDGRRSLREYLQSGFRDPFVPQSLRSEVVSTARGIVFRRARRSRDFHAVLGAKQRQSCRCSKRRVESDSEANVRYKA